MLKNLLTTYGMKSPSIELPFPASRRRKYYVPTQELLRGDAGKWARRGRWIKGKGEKVKVKR